MKGEEEIMQREQALAAAEAYARLLKRRFGARRVIIPLAKGMMETLEALRGQLKAFLEGRGKGEKPVI